jgi:hypothetical protein
MNCHNCIHHRTLPGNAHIECDVPLFDQAAMLLIWMHSLTSKGNMIYKSYDDSFEVELNSTGIKGGWAMWPINFDPIWIVRCTRYKEKEDN